MHPHTRTHAHTYTYLQVWAHVDARVTLSQALHSQHARQWMQWGHCSLLIGHSAQSLSSSNFLPPPPSAPPAHPALLFSVLSQGCGWGFEPPVCGWLVCEQIWGKGIYILPECDILIVLILSSSLSSPSSSLSAHFRCKDKFKSSFFIVRMKVNKRCRKWLLFLRPLYICGGLYLRTYMQLFACYFVCMQLCMHGFMRVCVWL